MKLLSKQIDGKDGGGVVTLIPEESEDLWHLYNLVTKGDRVKAQTFRKVVKEGSTGSVSSEVKRMVLTISVKSVEYDAEGDLLRFAGRNVEENQYIKLGQYHTIELPLHGKMAVLKSCWDSVHLERLREATDPHKSAEVAAVLIDAGVAHLFLLTACLAKDLCKVVVNIPKKRGPWAGHDKAMHKFFETVLSAMQQHIDFSVVKCVLLAGPGFVKDDFMSWMLNEASMKGLTTITSNRHLFVTAKASSPYKQALNEVLQDPTVKAKMQNTKAQSQVAALDKLYSTLQNDPDRACYGPKHVAVAVERGAVQALLVTDGLFRSANVQLRKRYVHMSDVCKAAGAEVHVFSDMHVSGEQLGQLSGIAALLRFPLPELDDIEDDDKPIKDKQEAYIDEGDLGVEDDEPEGGGALNVHTNDLFADF
eukprot:GDKI01030640.1.p1 GENE.GDKI01030640.1~~GDKI01030640.1.p1  ORF type:complete len:421 (+),score=108.11 GDKI01030640.1:106-1368(+)